jgi:hypothetical protein
MSAHACYPSLRSEQTLLGMTMLFQGASWSLVIPSDAEGSLVGRSRGSIAVPYSLTADGWTVDVTPLTGAGSWHRL